MGRLEKWHGRAAPQTLAPRYVAGTCGHWPAGRNRDTPPSPRGRGAQRSHPAVWLILHRHEATDTAGWVVSEGGDLQRAHACGVVRPVRGARRPPAAHTRAGCRRDRRATGVRAAVPAAARVPAARARGAVLGRRPALPRARARHAARAREPGRLARSLHGDGRRRAVRAAAARPSPVASLLPAAARGRAARHRLQDAPRAGRRQVGGGAGAAAVRRRSRRAADDPRRVEAGLPAERARPHARLAARRRRGNGVGGAAADAAGAAGPRQRAGHRAPRRARARP